MRIFVARGPKELGEEAARLTAEALNAAIRKKGWARMVLGTGASQLEALAALTKQQVSWRQVEVFQICERMGLAENDPGSCRKALKERFEKKLPGVLVHYLDGTEKGMQAVSAQIRRAPVDVMLTGLGEQGQIGFNQAPADFEADGAYLMLEPEAAENPLITLSIREMMRCERVIACAPYGIHAENVWQIMTHRLSPELPATALKLHRSFDLLLDADSAAKISVELAARFNPELEEYRLPLCEETGE